jgi:hypothetical protein
MLLEVLYMFPQANSNRSRCDSEYRREERHTDPPAVESWWAMQHCKDHIQNQISKVSYSRMNRVPHNVIIQ